MKGDLKEEEHHGDDHPDVNHLYIGGGWQSLGDAYEAEKRFCKKNFDFQSLQCCEYKECSEVDLYHHVDIFVSKDLTHLSQHDEDRGRDEHGKDVSDQGPPEDQNDNQSSPVVSKS